MKVTVRMYVSQYDGMVEWQVDCEEPTYYWDANGVLFLPTELTITTKVLVEDLPGEKEGK